MKKIDLRELHKNAQKYDKQQVTVGGWVRSCRSSKTFGFIDLNDGTSFNGVQIVFEENLNNFEQIEKLNTGSSILVSGTLVLTPENKQPFEIKASNVEIISATDETYPIQKKRASVEFLREIAYLRPRTNR